MINIKENFTDRFADNLSGSRSMERFCHVVDKNVFLSVDRNSNTKMCFSHPNCKKKDNCKLLKIGTKI